MSEKIPITFSTKDKYITSIPSNVKLHPFLTKLDKGWIASEIIGVRNGEGTYDYFPLDELPKCPIEFHGNWDWKLKENEDEEEQRIIQLSESGLHKEECDIFPELLKQLMNSAKLQGGFESPTACYFLTCKPIGPFKRYLPTNEFYVIPFFNDQQGCCTWFVFFDKKVTDFNIVGSWQNPCVVVSNSLFYEHNLDCNLQEDLTFVCYSLEEFIWRVGFESTLWYKCCDYYASQMPPKTKEEREYCLHYKLIGQRKEIQEKVMKEWDSKVMKSVDNKSFSDISLVVCCGEEIKENEPLLKKKKL
ncbi:hypothetical protein ABK040_003394 [Willaertia magna]